MSLVSRISPAAARIVLCFATLLLGVWGQAGVAETVSPEPPAPPRSRVGDLAREVLLKSVPKEHEDTRDWGHTKRVWDGLKVSFDGLRIKTKRRHKDANHGTWKRYKLWFIDPENQIRVQVLNLTEGDGSAEFDLVMEARLGASARLSEWRRDVQLFSFSAEGEADVELSMHCSVKLELELVQFPPDLVLSPTVTSANLRLVDFKLHRISDANGPLVRQLGRSLHGEVQDQLDRQKLKLVEKINKQIVKHRDELRLSIRDFSGQGKQEVMDLLRQAGESAGAADGP